MTADEIRKRLDAILEPDWTPEAIRRDIILAGYEHILSPDVKTPPVSEGR